MTADTHGWLAAAVATFGEDCRAKLAGPGDREAAIRAPLERLLRTAGERLGVPAVFHDEVRDVERQVRPDYGVSVGGAINGYIEVKSPGHPLEPTRFSGHDKIQWERQRDLPNLIYTNGTHWRLYRDGELLSGPVVLEGGSLELAGHALIAPPELEGLLTDFLRWRPAPITSVGALVRAIAPLTRLLRGEVLDQLASERRAIGGGAEAQAQPFTGLSRDWRALLFPQADDATFADGYAQAVTFALLLARTEGIEVAGVPLHQVGSALGQGHSLMGKALQLLTDDVAADFRVTLDLLVRVVGAVDWPRVRRGRRDTYLQLYEHFLELYDNELRKRSGSYYTPREVVDQMVRLTEQALVRRLGKPTGFRDPTVLTVDPAMGTGTFLHTILERVAQQAASADGPGVVPGIVTQVAGRLVGFELQMGPYAVAELRTADLLASHGAAPPPGGMRLYVTDTLDDPHAAETQLASGLQLLAASRRRANEVKATADVTVVIGNPPYKELAVGDGGWVESGGAEHGPIAEGILSDWFLPGMGRFKAKLKNLYVYFWRWATWKVWESTPRDVDGGAGVVCFISTSGYLTGPAFTGMRQYLRRQASEGWIIDLTPEGQTPDVPTRIFPGVRQPLSIGLFLRRPHDSPDTPALIRYRSVSGRQEEKFAALAEIDLDDGAWREVRTGWTDPLTPAAEGVWDSYPALSDLMPWYSPGVFPTRTWVYAPNVETLRRRWQTLIGQDDPAVKSALFKEGRDANLDKYKEPLPGVDVHRDTTTPVRGETSTQATAVRVGYRSFDRQWILADSRLMDMPRRDLWAARQRGQVFVVELHTAVLRGGPGVTFSSLIPDFHYFKGSEGGRTLPFLHPDGTANLAPGLSAALEARLGLPVSDLDVLAYLAAVTAHPGYTATFADELTTPGIRVPLTTDTELWAEAVRIGEQVVRLHTFGEAFSDSGPEPHSVRYPAGDSRQPLALTPITSIPATMVYDQARQVLRLGDGEFGPVMPAVYEFSVGGRSVLTSWFGYRKAEPGGRRSGSALDRVVATEWDPDWTAELIDLLSVLSQLVDLEPQQAEVLSRIHQSATWSLSDLAAAGVRLPRSADHRRPRGTRLTLGGEDSLGQGTLIGTSDG